jgi:endonuclease III
MLYGGLYVGVSFCRLCFARNLRQNDTRNHVIAQRGVLAISLDLGSSSQRPNSTTARSNMRTSKVSRETARLVSALATSPRKTRSTHRSLREFAHTANGPPTAIAVREEIGTEQPDSELSDIASSDNEDAVISRKRKRGQETPIAVVKTENTEIENATTGNGASTTAKTRRKPARKVKTEDGDIKIEPPTNWEEVYSLTQEMRKTLPAPVDTMGCERLFDPAASARDQRFQTLISLMLSSQTKDTVTSAAVRRMQSELPGSLCLESILTVEPAVLDSMIGKVGFHNTKTKHIKLAAEVIRDKWDSDIPDSIAGLVSLPGVGPKMAHLCMSAAWGRTEGIGVDVHVHRITNLWGWHKTKTPEETRKSLESWLPREKWHEINGLLVGFGQVLCTPVGRKCGECRLAERGLCPGSVVKRKIKREAKAEVKVDGGSVKIKEVKVEEYEVTAGEVEVGDIEDFGRRRSRRGKPTND